MINAVIMPTKITKVIPEQHEISLPLFKAEPGVTILEIIQKPFSKLSISYLQNGALDVPTTIRIRISLEQGAKCNTFCGIFGSRPASLFIETYLNGDGSELQEKTVYFGNQNQMLDMRSSSVLKGIGARAHIESKGIITGNCQARFDGNIHILETAKGGEAKLTEHTLLLSPNAVMNAIPGLTIDTNDVIAMHSASMTRVSDEQLFYAGSRGIGKPEAVRMIAEGFLKGVYNDSPYSKKIDTLIQEKLCKL